MSGTDNDYRIVWPQSAIPGSLAVVCSPGRLDRLIQYDSARSRVLYTVRAIISDHIPLAGNIADVISSLPRHQIALNETPLTIYLHHGGESAIFFDLCASNVNALSHISVEVEADAPLAAFQFARTAVNELLDTLMRRVWMPIMVSRLELFADKDPAPLAFQIPLPFPSGLNIGPLGGIHQYPVFSELESLSREAICATSPYYRLLCAYRIFEGIAKLKAWLRVTMAQLKVDAHLPEPLEVDHILLQDLGFQPKMLSDVVNVDDLHKKLRVHRNRVSHFLLDRKKDETYPPLHLSDGHSYLDFSMAGSALLHYAHRTIAELSSFFHQHLESPLARGSILPLKEQRSRFRVLAPITPNQPGST